MRPSGYLRAILWSNLLESPLPTKSGHLRLWRVELWATEWITAGGHDCWSNRREVQIWLQAIRMKMISTRQILSTEKADES